MRFQIGSIGYYNRRSPKIPTLQLLQKSSKSASTTPQRPIWNTFGTVAVRDFWENGCRRRGARGCHVTCIELMSCRRQNRIRKHPENKKCKESPQSTEKQWMRAPAGTRSDPAWEGGRAGKQRTWGAGGAGRRAAGGVSLCGLEADPDVPPVWLRAGGCKSSRVPQKTDFLWDPILSEYPRWKMGTRPFPGHLAISFAPPRVSRRPWY